MSTVLAWLIFFVIVGWMLAGIFGMMQEFEKKEEKT